MQLQLVRITNFRPYAGTTEIEFPQDAGSNIHVIQGRNGAGKTSVHEAIRWALHAPNEMGGPRTHFKRVNDRARTEEDTEMVVRLKFRHEGTVYDVIRTATVTGSKHATVSLELFRDGEAVGGNADGRQEILDNIIPPNVSEFLFFDGEEMEALAQQMNGENEGTAVREQIELLIGLKAVQNLETDLAFVKSCVSEDLDEERQQRAHKEELGDQLAEKKQLRDELSDEIGEMDAQIADLADQKERIEVKLDELESDQVEQAQTLKAELDLLDEEQIPQQRDAFQEAIEDAYVFILDDQIRETIEQLQEEKAGLETQLSDLHGTDAKLELLHTSLETDHCALCTRPLDAEVRTTLADKQHQFESTEADQDAIETEKVAVTERISSLETSLQVLDRESPATVKQELERLHDTKQEKQQAYAHLQQEIAAGVDEKSEWQTEKRNLEEELATLRAKQDDRRDRRDALTDEIEAIRDEVDQLEATDYTTELQKQTEAITASLDDLQTVRDELTKTKRTGILARANEVFAELTAGTRGYDRFEFIDDESYGFQLITDDGHEPDMTQISKGEKQIVALSFIMGLSRYADRTAPLVMDTPIARLDREYRENFATLLTSLDQQVVLFVTDASLTGGFETILQEQHPQSWEITEDVATQTSTIRPAVNGQ